MNKNRTVGESNYNTIIQVSHLQFPRKHIVSLGVDTIHQIIFFSQQKRHMIKLHASSDKVHTTCTNPKCYILYQ